MVTEETGDTLIDAFGTRHVPAQGDVRIVSLVPSITELLCALGLHDKLVGRTGFCVHPSAVVRSIPKVGGTKDVDIEKVRALRPTHVIVNIDENRRETAEALRDFAPHIVVTHPCAPQDNVALYRMLGAIFERHEAADRLSRSFDAALDGCRHAARRFTPETVLYLIWRDPWMTVAQDTYISRTLALVNWQTFPQQSAARYPEVVLDGATLEPVDRILLSSEPYRFTDRHVAELGQHPALRGKAVALIDGEMTSWYGSRAIEGLKYLTRFRLGNCAAGRAVS
jgi:ABC-type Fe3+-hydroxamate transport system substrate-binding protein